MSLFSRAARIFQNSPPQLLPSEVPQE
jgi:hypothetical protein